MAQIVIEKIIQDEDKEELEKEEAQALKNDSKTIEIDH